MFLSNIYNKKTFIFNYKELICIYHDGKMPFIKDKTHTLEAES
ncbi:hypothetical protein [Candidatus Phytoplasma tritici]|nr:hypothetical protein [Candidatus Phytoplasma tritici]